MAVPLPLHAIDVGDGPPIVLLHGWGMAAEAWDRQLTRFSATHRCVALDLRGHGASPKPAAGYGYDDHVADVAAAVARLGLERPVLVGWSMGGAVAALAAHAIDGVRGVVLAGSPPSLLARPGYPHGATPEDARGLVDAIRANREQAYRRVADETCAVDVGATTRDWLLSLLLRVPGFAAIGAFEGVLAGDARGAIEALPVPLLVVHGTHDAYVPLDAARWSASAAPDAELVVLDGCGHAPFLEAPDAFDDALSRFLARVDA